MNAEIVVKVTRFRDAIEEAVALCDDANAHDTGSIVAALGAVGAVLRRLDVVTNPDIPRIG